VGELTGWMPPTHPATIPARRAWAQPDWICNFVVGTPCPATRPARKAAYPVPLVAQGV